MTQGTPFEIIPNPNKATDEERNAVLANPAFGQEFTDHMVSIDWDEANGWHNAQVRPYGPISLDPATNVFHYGQAIFEGLDLQPSLIQLARENALRNGLNDRVGFTCGDLRNIRKLYSHQSFDALVVNPPYEDPGFGVSSRYAVNRSARQGETCTLEDVCLAARFLLKNGGRLYMVMRALRLADTLALLKKHRLEPRRLRMVHPLPGKNASVFLTEARRSGGAALTVEPPLFIDDGRGNFTPELMEFYGPEPPSNEGVSLGP